MKGWPGRGRGPQRRHDDPSRIVDEAPVPEVREPELCFPPDVGLTRREREIAALAARGLTNREIAARLVVSVRTVEGHLYQAFGKLGVTARVELPGLL